MRLDLLPPGSWESYCEELAEHFPKPEGVAGLRAYRGTAHALYESLVAIAQLYPHKRSLVVVDGTTPHFSPQLKYFSKEGYNILRQKPEDLESESWAESLPNDCLLVLAADEHAVTGELFDLKRVEEATALGRIFFVRYSHSLWRTDRNPSLGKYSLQVCRVNSDLAVLVHGARFKAPPILTQNMYWSGPSDQELQQLGKKSELKMEVIEGFEAKLPGGIKALFPKGAHRLYDRSVIELEDMSAEAFIEEFAQLMGIKLSKAPSSTLVDTPNQCRWGDIDWQAWWTHHPPSAEAFRGLVVLDQELFEQQELVEKLSEAYEQVKSQQSFTTPD